MYFWNFGLRKTSIDKCWKSLVSEHRSTVNIAEGSETPRKYERQIFYHILLSLWVKWRCKKSLLFISEILGQFVITLTANEKFILHNSEDLRQPILIKLYQKEKTFVAFFASFLKCKLNLEHFQRDDDLHGICISEITDSERPG